MRMEMTITRKTLLGVVAALIALSAYGAYQGWRRSAADDVANGSAILPTTPAVTGARNASPLVEPPPPALTEADVREIARQEARAALTREQAPATETDQQAAPAPSTPIIPPAAPLTPRPIPAPAPANPPSGDAAPLF